MEPRSKAEVGARVKARRLELRMTPSELVAAAGIDDKTLQRLEDGTRWPQERTRLKIEPVLLWAPGSIEQILRGGEPTVAVSDEPASSDVAAGYAPARIERRDGDKMTGGYLDTPTESELGPELLNLITDQLAKDATPDQRQRLEGIRREVEQTERLLGPMAHIPEVEARYARLMYRFAIDSLIALSRPLGPSGSNAGRRIDWGFDAPKWVDPGDDLAVVRLATGGDDADRIRLMRRDDLETLPPDYEILGSIPADGSHQVDYELARRTGDSLGAQIRDQHDSLAEAPDPPAPEDRQDPGRTEDEESQDPADLPASSKESLRGLTSKSERRRPGTAG